MKKTFICIFVLPLLFIVQNVSAQIEERDGLFIANSYPGSAVETKELEKSLVAEGSFFINNNWLLGDVLLFDERIIEKMPLKYNLRDDQLVILDETQISRVLRFDKIDKFVWFDIDKKRNITFTNSLEFNSNGSGLVGFLEILVEGEWFLYRHYNLILTRGNYSITHDAGQLNDEYVIEENFYLGKDKTLYAANKKKEIKSLLNDKNPEVEKFIKSRNIKFNKEEDLASLIRYYNSL